MTRSLWIPMMLSDRRRRACLLLILFLVPLSSDGQRLFFDAADVPAIRAKLQQEPFASMAAAIEGQLNPTAGDGVDDSRSRIGARATEARNAASMYVLTGEQHHADRALEMVEALVAETDFWGVSSANSLRRSEMGAAVTQAYDFASTAWDVAARDNVATELVRNADSLMQGGGSGWPGNQAPANNWHGVRWSTAIISYLAADDPAREAAIDVAYDNLVTHFEANLAGNTDQRDNGRGWNPEGMGYTQWPSNRSWGQAAVALKRLRDRDLLADGPPGLKYTLSTAHISAVAIEGINGDIGIIPDFSDDSNFLAGRGLGNFAFVHSPEEYVPALRWQYDRLWGAEGRGNYDSLDGAGIWGVLYYPDDVPAQNPEEVWGLNYVDEHFAMIMFRDRYQDENDIVAMHSARWRNANGILENTHWGPDVNGLRIIGLNSVWATSGKNDAQHQTTVSAADPADIGRINPDRQGPLLGSGVLNEYYTHSDDGSGYSVVTGSDMGDSQSPTPFGTLAHVRRFGVDYDSEATGVRGVFVVGDSSFNGSYWRWNAGGMNAITTDAEAGEFTITSPDGHRLIGYVLHGDASTLRTGSVERSRDIPYEGELYDNNVWVDFQNDTDNNFLVLMQMVEAGDEPSPWVASGEGYTKSLRVARQTYHVEEDRVWAESWNDWTGGDGLFSDAGNWRFATPSGENAWATFESASPIEVTVDADATLSNLVIGGQGEASLSGDARLTLASPDGTARVEVSGAGGEIGVDLVLSNLALIDVSSAAEIAIIGEIDFEALLVKEGEGLLTLGEQVIAAMGQGDQIALLGGAIATPAIGDLIEVDSTAAASELTAAGFDLSDGLTVWEASITSLLPGDYNDDGLVDAADYTVWRDGGSADSSQAGYDVWAANYADPADPALSSPALSSPATVPEPGAALTTIVTALLAMTRRRRAGR